MRARLVAALCVPGLLAAQLAPAQAEGTFERRFDEIKGSASRVELYRFLHFLPKGGDLHNHHEYSVSMRDWLEVATDPRLLHGNRYFTRTRLGRCPDEPGQPLLFKNVRSSTYEALPACIRRDYEPLTGLAPQTREAWISSLQVQPGGGQEEFFERIVRRLLELERDPYLMAELLIRQMRHARSEGLRYLETQLDPRESRDSGGAAVSADLAADIVRRRLAQPDALDTGVAVRLQVSTLRFSLDAESDLADGYAFVHRNHDLWVGVNLVGREDNPEGRPLRFLEPLRRLRRKYGDVALSLHAGESTSPDRAVRESLPLGATRIGHGLNLLSDSDTLLLMRNNRYLIETSLVSNQLLGFTPDLATHPFPEYLRLGIPVCLNTDDRGAWDSSMDDEYFLAVTNFDLSWDEVVRLGRDSLTYSFAEEPLKTRLVADFDRAVRDFEVQYGAPDWRARLATRVIPSGYASRVLGIGQ